MAIRLPAHVTASRYTSEIEEASAPMAARYFSANSHSASSYAITALRSAPPGPALSRMAARTSSESEICSSTSSIGMWSNASM